jgi:predicted AAA+ superfamily ATPase
LGSSALLVQRGLAESLAGRFEVIPVTHWSFEEMRKAFGWNVDEYIFFGGYPGAAELIQEEERWSNYIRDALRFQETFCS